MSNKPNKVKSIPNFNIIHRTPLIQSADGHVVLTRLANDGKTEKREHFRKINGQNAGQGTFGTGYLSLGVEQRDANNKLIVDANGKPILKEATKGGNFQRFIKEYISVKEYYHSFGIKFDSLSPEEQQRATEKYEKKLIAAAERAYHNGQLASKNVVMDSNTGKYYLVMHAIKGMELQKYLEKNKDTITSEDKITIAANIASAIKADGDRNIVHNDIKPQNYMIDPVTLAVRAIDYDASQEITNGSHVKSIQGTMMYFPPERFGKKTKSSKKSDVYSGTATIIDTFTHGMTNISYRNAYNFQINKSPNFDKQEFQEQYFGKKPGQGKQNYFPQVKIFAGVEMCQASFDRMMNLRRELNEKFPLLRHEEKAEFIVLCAHGLAIDPNQRPTQAELDVLVST